MGEAINVPDFEEWWSQEMESVSWDSDQTKRIAKSAARCAWVARTDALEQNRKGHGRKEKDSS